MAGEHDGTDPERPLEDYLKFRRVMDRVGGTG